MNAAAPFAIGLGAAGLVGGLVAGVLAERGTAPGLQRRENGVQAEAQRRGEWSDAATKHFATEIEFDRQRSRQLDAEIEDYRLANPGADGSTLGRTNEWSSYPMAPAGTERNELWWSTIGGGLGAATIGGITLGVAVGTAPTSRSGAAIGAALLGIGAGAVIGSAVSSWLN